VALPESTPAGRIYEVVGEYVIADGGGWLPGCYADRPTAELALTMDYDTLRRLNDNRPKGDQYAPITVEDLRTASAEDEQGG